MFIVIDNKLYLNTVSKCVKSKFSKSTLHYKDAINNGKKAKVILTNEKLFMYHPTRIYGKEIIPRSLLLLKICSVLSEIVIL